MTTIWTKEEIIQAVFEEFEGIMKHSLITKAEQMGLADWNYDCPIMRSLDNDDELLAVYFMFAHFILLALEEES